MDDCFSISSYLQDGISLLALKTGLLEFRLGQAGVIEIVRNNIPLQDSLRLVAQVWTCG